MGCSYWLWQGAPPLIQVPHASQGPALQQAVGGPAASCTGEAAGAGVRRDCPGNVAPELLVTYTQWLGSKWPSDS